MVTIQYSGPTGTTGTVEYSAPVYGVPAPDVESLRSAFASSLEYGIGQANRQQQNIYAGRGITGSGEEKQGFGDVQKWAGSQVQANESNLQNLKTNWQEKAFNFEQQSYQNALNALPVEGSAADTPDQKAMRNYLRSKLLGMTVTPPTTPTTTTPTAGAGTTPAGTTPAGTPGTYSTTPTQQNPNGTPTFIMPSSFESTPAGGYYTDATTGVTYKKGTSINDTVPVDPNDAGLLTWKIQQHPDFKKLTVGSGAVQVDGKYYKMGAGNMPEEIGAEEGKVMSDPSYINASNNANLKIGGNYYKKTPSGVQPITAVEYYKAPLNSAENTYQDAVDNGNIQSFVDNLTSKVSDPFTLYDENGNGVPASSVPLYLRSKYKTGSELYGDKQQISDKIKNYMKNKATAVDNFIAGDESAISADDVDKFMMVTKLISRLNSVESGLSSSNNDLWKQVASIVGYTPSHELK